MKLLSLTKRLSEFKGFKSQINSVVKMTLRQEYALENLLF